MTYSNILDKYDALDFVIVQWYANDGKIAGVHGPFKSYGQAVNYIDCHFGDCKTNYGFQITKLMNLD